MDLGRLKNNFITSLESEYPRQEVETFFYWLTEFYLGKNRLQVALHPEIEIDPQHLKKFDEAVKRLQNHEPIQYIVGECDFYGLKFGVSPAVLVPRPETEELVQWMLEDISPNSQSVILDIGTGSGCIAISLAKNLSNSKISAVDISSEALILAKANAKKNKVKVEFIQLDILATEKLNMKVDHIVSNPPYVRELEKNEMQRNVLEHEPTGALYVKDEDPLVFYGKLAELGRKQLKEKGSIFLEINQYLGKETQSLFEEAGFRTELRKDIFGKDRMLKAWK